MPNHKLSKNVCLEEILPVAQWIVVSQTNLTVSLYVKLVMRAKQPKRWIMWQNIMALTSSALFQSKPFSYILSEASRETKQSTLCCKYPHEHTSQREKSGRKFDTHYVSLCYVNIYRLL